VSGEEQSIVIYKFYLIAGPFCYNNPRQASKSRV